MTFEPIKMTAREAEFVKLREITTEEVRAVAMPVLPPVFERPYGHSISREMYKLWYRATMRRWLP